MKPQEKVNLIIKEAEDAIEQVMGNRVVLLLSQGNKIINRLNIDAAIADNSSLSATQRRIPSLKNNAPIGMLT